MPSAEQSVGQVVEQPSPVIRAGAEEQPAAEGGLTPSAVEEKAPLSRFHVFLEKAEAVLEVLVLRFEPQARTTLHFLLPSA